MNYVDEKYIVNDEGMIVEEIDNQEDRKLDENVDPLNYDFIDAFAVENG